MTTVAVITGGASGIGLATALQLAQRDVTVVVADCDAVRLAGVEAALTATRPGDHLSLLTDVADEASVATLVRTVTERYGRLDYLLHSAATIGRGGFRSLVHWPADECDRLLAVNIKGTALVLKHAIPLMLTQPASTIITMASFVGTRIPVPNAALYGATKAAVVSLTASVAADFGRRGLRCLALCPWITDTPMLDQMLGPMAGAKRMMAQLNPSGRMVKSHDVATVAVSLFFGERALHNGGALLVDADGACELLYPALSD